MDLNKYTERAKGFLQNMQTLAQRSAHQRVTPEHLLKVLLDDPEGLAAGLVAAAGGNVAVATAENDGALANWPKFSSRPKPSPKNPATSS